VRSPFSITSPDGFVVGLIVFVGAYTLTPSLHGLNWVLLAGICDSCWSGSRR